MGTQHRREIFEVVLDHAIEVDGRILVATTSGREHRIKEI